MPYLPKKRCKYAGCIALTNEKYCEKHKHQVRLSNDRQRTTSSKRGYDYRWQQLREIYLHEHPLCEICEDNRYVNPAALVHHIVPIEQGGDALDMENLQSLCNDCHDKIHKHIRFGNNMRGRGV